MKIAIALLMIVASVSAGFAAFESLPGPAPGGASHWAWSLRDGRAAAWRGGLSIGRPAAVDGLAWTHAWGGRRLGRLDLVAELYGFGLHDLYREGIAGLWMSSRGLGIGLRRWQAAWGDGLQRNGWTGCAELALRRGRTSGRLVAENIAPASPDRAGPRPAMAVSLARRIGTALDATASIRRSRLGSTGVWRIHWSPVSAVGLTEEFVTPGSLTSGLELRASRLRVGLWFTPLAAIGPRTGISLSWGA
jgi:hypothetical protein